ncbi:hypothetical protein GCM10027317_47420 [Massilia agri]
MAMVRRIPELLEGGYVVLIKNRLQADEKTDPAKWALWKIIWDCTSFEELAQRASDPVNTSRTGRRITWRTEVRWALQQGWIKKTDP